MVREESPVSASESLEVEAILLCDAAGCDVVEVEVEAKGIDRGLTAEVDDAPDVVGEVPLGGICEGS